MVYLEFVKRNETTGVELWRICHYLTQEVIIATAHPPPPLV